MVEQGGGYCGHLVGTGKGILCPYYGTGRGILCPHGGDKEGDSVATWWGQGGRRYCIYMPCGWMSLMMRRSSYRVRVRVRVRVRWVLTGD